MKLPYGISNFKILRSKPYFYADRTPFIERLEGLGELYLMFLRPRRFGKSLFLSTLEFYYGIEHKALFSDLFGQTYIGQTPTQEANTYKILRFDFSGVETSEVESTIQSFLKKVSVGISSFIDRYADSTVKEVILTQPTPAMMISEFFNIFKNESIYLLVDEYDHFANEILAKNFDQFLKFVGKDEFVRKFYEVIKTATGEGIVQRMFITGVTPITLDSLTSGFNIAKDLSVDEDFNGMMGFTREETHGLLQKLCDVLPNENASTEAIMEDLKRWYNGYRFHPNCKERIYNPDMILYFATAFARKGNYPDQMIDTNIASDYGKIQGLFQIKNPEQNYQVLEKLIKEGHVQSELTAQFSFEKYFDGTAFRQQDFISLLFYLGFISIEGKLLNNLVFSIPNHVIQRLFWDYFIALLENHQGMTIQVQDVKTKLIELAQENRIEPFLGLIENTLQTLSNRDAMNFDEKYIKALFVGFANLANLYFIKSETEVQKRYPDIMLLYRKPIQPNYQFIIELKYLKKSELDQLDAKFAEAETQLQGYLQSPEIKALDSLKAWAVVFVGDQVRKVKEI